MTSTPHINPISRFVQQLSVYPRVLVSLGVLGIVTIGAIGPDWRPAPPIEVFRPPLHPALVYQGPIAETFDLGDPIVIAVINESREGVFSPHTLALVDWLTAQLAEVGHDIHPHVLDPDHIVSLTTADRMRSARIEGPQVSRTLVTPDGSATFIATELLEPTQAAAVYHVLVALLHDAPVTGETLQLKVPGQPLVTTTLDPLRNRLTRQAHAIAAGALRESAHHHEPLF